MAVPSAAREDSQGDPRSNRLAQADTVAQAPPVVEAPTRQMVSATGGEQCTNCGAPLATDQFYCLNCGERRGKARFSFAGLSAPPAAAAVARPPIPPRRPRVSSGATLVAGIGTLLLAMGVGVLIGEQGKNNQRTPVAAAPQVITVQGGGGTATAASTPGGTTASTARSHKKAKAATKVVITKKIQAKAAVAAAKALGGANLAPPTSTIGSSCASGQAGCQNGKFTGTFFGP